MVHELAGKPAPRSLLANIPRLVSAYFARKPDPSDPNQRVAFGTSGHRGSALKSSFNEDHILAVSQAICEYRAMKKITGPLFIDNHPQQIRRASGDLDQIFLAVKIETSENTEAIPERGR